MAHGSTGNAGENGCSHYSPSVLINFIPSSMLIIDNLVGSRPSFLTAPCKLLPDAQQLTLVSLRKQNNTPSKKRKNNNKQKPKLIPAELQTKHLMVPMLWSARTAPSGLFGKEDALRNRAAWLT